MDYVAEINEIKSELKKFKGMEISNKKREEPLATKSLSAGKD